ncbi:MAG: HU family DNA-binding protein, partial [Firmicutes bacterium]|nr:HU family DNA-binding protein [Bacillota bacterium]
MEKIATRQVIKEVAERMGCYRTDAREVLDHFADVIRENVSAGRKVQYAGLGVLLIGITYRL